MPSQLEHAMETVMFTYHKYAGDKNYLVKEDLRLLMEKEVPGYMEVSEEKGCGGGVSSKDPSLGKGLPPVKGTPTLRQPFSSFFSSSSSVITLSLLSSP